MLRPGRLWYLLCRDLRRGWRASFHAHRTLQRITEMPPLSAPGAPLPVSLHVLTGRDDWQLACWMLASWQHFSGRAGPIVIHDDGTLPDEGRDTLQTLFADVRIIARAEADFAMEQALQPFPACASYRRAHPLARKIFDVPHFAAERFMVFDSDLLFFGTPPEIVDWSESERDECWFNEDVADTALITADEAREVLGVALRLRVNSGLCLLPRAAIDLAFCERALTETSILQGHVWRIEQTLFALCASRHGAGGLLPRCYEVSLGQDAAPDAISRHYVGAVRNRFYGEGLRRLAPVLLPGKARKTKSNQRLLSA